MTPFTKKMENGTILKIDIVSYPTASALTRKLLHITLLIQNMETEPNRILCIH